MTLPCPRCIILNKKKESLKLPDPKFPHLLLLFTVQSLSCVWLFATLWISAPGFPVLHYLPEFAQTHVHWVSDAFNHLSSVIPFSCLPSFPAAESFPMSQFFTSGGWSIETPASAAVLPMNIQRGRILEHTLYGFCFLKYIWKALNLSAWHRVSTKYIFAVILCILGNFHLSFGLRCYTPGNLSSPLRFGGEPIPISPFQLFFPYQCQYCFIIIWLLAFLVNHRFLESCKSL